MKINALGKAVRASAIDIKVLDQKHDNFHDQELRRQFVLGQTSFDKDGYSRQSTIKAEIVDIRGSIVEIQIEKNKFLFLDRATLERAIKNFEVDNET